MYYYLIVQQQVNGCDDGAGAMCYAQSDIQLPGLLSITGRVPVLSTLHGTASF